MSVIESFNDDIVVSGMSGKCANSDNIGEFRDQIYNKIDMLTNSTRFQLTADCPVRYGTISHINKFDNVFFAIPENQIDNMDPVTRMGMEIVCEALWDAGINLEEIKGSKTCIYNGNCYSEAENQWRSILVPDQNQFSRMTKTLFLDTISHFLEIDGPKCGTDSACSSSIFTLEHAVRDLRSGKVDYAICAGQNLSMSNTLTRQFYDLGIISSSCKSFDADASGYVRSDGILVVILQRAKHAKRQYAKLEHVLTNCDGFKEMGITFPSEEGQGLLFEKFYADLGVSMDRIGYVEAHGTGTKVGDPVELSAIESFFCKDRKDPLYIGSVKSNLGHCEAASAIASLMKACWIIDSNKIAPNIHFHSPNPMITGLYNGKLNVVTEVTDLPEDKPYVAISNFGFGGANGHILLTRSQKQIERVSDDTPGPRLICLSGRTYEGILSLYNDLKVRPFDPDFIAMINASFGGKTNMLHYKGFCLADKHGISALTTKESTSDMKPLICFFQTSGVAGLIPKLMHYKRFQKHIKNVEEIFILHKINIILPTKLIVSEEDCKYNTLLTVVVQTGIVELFKELKLNISTFSGSGIGELSAAYADGILNLDQTIITANRFVGLISEGVASEKEKLRIDNIQEICKLVSPPRKWKLQESRMEHENLAEYFVNVSSKHNYSMITNSNIVIIGGNASNVTNCIHICDANSNSSFLNAIGHLHLLSYHKDVNSLFSVQWPVKAQTPMISPLLKWNHRKLWKDYVEKDSRGVQKYHIKLTNADWQNVVGHNIDGRVVFPASGYIRLAMACFCNTLDYPVRLDNVTFHRACNISEGHDLTLTVQIQRTTGEFQITEDMTVVVSGIINFENNFDKEFQHLPSLPAPKAENLMSKRDIYQELGIRGYYYENEYREMQTCDINVTVAQVKWTDWCPFLETMLQMKFLAEDTRSLFIPAKLRQILINPAKHSDLVRFSDISRNSVLSVHYYKEQNIIRCGYIEIRGIEIACVPRRRNPTPLLEIYKFIPYIGSLDIENVIRVILQIALENSYTLHLKAVEDFYDLPSTINPLSPYIERCLNDHRFILPELHIHTNRFKELEDFPSILVTDKAITADSNYIAIGFNLSQNAQLFNDLKSCIKAGGYLISREEITSNYSFDDMSVICEYNTNTEKIVMLQARQTIHNSIPIHVAEHDFEWVDQIKTAKRNKDNLLLFSQNENKNGLLGLSNCLLLESEAGTVTTVLINDKHAPKFDCHVDIYKKQLAKNIRINVLKDGKWGSYRHLLIDHNISVETTHSYANNVIAGDMSSLTWFQGHLSIPKDLGRNMEEIEIYSTSLNFNDILIASGKITHESVEPNRIQQDQCLGLDFAGYRKNGDRVMGIIGSGSISNLIHVPTDNLWEIPDNWSMDEAATVPYIYLSNIYGLLIRTQLEEGESILIHSATGGIGLSAINIALHFKCNIFVTVESENKKKCIMENYPTIPTSHIGNSTDISFYEMILKLTHGKGVTIILNVLGNEKLHTSVLCLGVGGRFIETGKFDCAADSPLGIELSNKNAEYHGVMLDEMLNSPNCGAMLKDIYQHMVHGIKTGYVKPVQFTKFNRSQLQPAFRHNLSDNHIGKVVLTIREENESILNPLQPLLTTAKPKMYCDPRGTYIIVGGLGGSGLELADFLILRGARRLVLVSRRGITTGYQRMRIKIWKSYGCKIHISTLDCTTKEGCEQMVNEAQKLGDVFGVFNLAMVIADALMENQNKDTFRQSYEPKAQCTILLDEITRRICPNLQYFVIYSSVTSGKGNPGQTNYGYSNSVMERICEQRVADGLPGKAIQWGLIGDVGIKLDYKELNIDLVIPGTLQQRIASCLESLDILLMSEGPVVSSMVLAKKQYCTNDDDIITVVSRLLGIKDIKTISPSSTFPEIGMDSMVAVDIKHTLERDFGLFLSPQELRKMNFSKFLEITECNTKTN